MEYMTRIHFDHKDFCKQKYKFLKKQLQGANKGRGITNTERQMCDASSRRTAAVSFTMCHCFPFLEVRDVVHGAGLVCRSWQKFSRYDALWETLFYRDTPLVVHTALEEAINKPLSDTLLAASAGVAAMLQQSVEERWDAVKCTRCATTASMPRWRTLHMRPTFSAS